MDEQPADRRRIQRISTTQEGQARFWLTWDAARSELRDLSLQGFAFAAESACARGTRLRFSIEWDAEPGEVAGEAEVVSASTASGQIGCRIVALDDDARELLRGWLAAHVRACAAVPITEGEAAEIVSGPSIV